MPTANLAKKGTMKHPIDPHDLRRFCVATEFDPRAVPRCLAGEPVRRSTRTLVTRAARELRVTLPTLVYPTA